MNKKFALVVSLLLVVGVVTTGWTITNSLQDVEAGKLLASSVGNGWKQRLLRIHLRHFHRFDPNTVDPRTGTTLLNGVVNLCAKDWKRVGCEDAAAILIDRGADVDRADSNKGGLTPLHGAVLHGAPEAAQFLLQRGASANANASGERFAGMTPLRFARELKEIGEGQAKVLEALRAAGGKE